MTETPGLCVWLTGLSGSGKTTTAVALGALLHARGQAVTVFDGDALRATMSADLGFSAAERGEHVRRVADLARRTVERSSIAVCALISPYIEQRSHAASIVGPARFIEVFVATPLHVCESRDCKGLYSLARAGAIRGMTGIDAPYQPPVSPAVTLDTRNPVEDNARRVLAAMIRRQRSNGAVVTCRRSNSPRRLTEIEAGQSQKR